MYLNEAIFYSAPLPSRRAREHRLFSSSPSAAAPPTPSAAPRSSYPIPARRRHAWPPGRPPDFPSIFLGFQERVNEAKGGYVLLTYVERGRQEHARTRARTRWPLIRRRSGRRRSPARKKRRGVDFSNVCFTSALAARFSMQTSSAPVMES